MGIETGPPIIKPEVSSQSRREILAGALVYTTFGGILFAAAGGFSSSKDSESAFVPAATPQAMTREIKNRTHNHEDVRISRNIRATRVSIPSLQFNHNVFGDYSIKDGTVIPDPKGGNIYTLEDDNIYFPNESYLYGHSSEKGVPQLFYSLQDLNITDRIVIDGRDRRTGEELKGLEFEATRLCIADIERLGALISITEGEELPRQPVLLLQTSVKPDIEHAYTLDINGRPKWIFDKEKMLRKADRMIDGDMEDPNKYLSLLVFAKLTKGSVEILSNLQ